MTASALRMHIPITKVDIEHRLVYGIATGETVDRSGEVCDYASTKPFYEAWSGDIAKATGGKSLGNVRAMHGAVAAGKVTGITFNDDAKQIEICAKVVDDAEWNKVQEGVYTGFSQGGSYEKRWTDADGLKRYTASPSEVSLVDLPCLPTATFQMVKAAGVVETKVFKSVVAEVPEPTNAEITAKAGELAKAAGKDSEWATFIEPARDILVKAALPAPAEAPAEAAPAADATPRTPADGVEQMWVAKDGSTHVKKADALAKNAEIEAKASVEPSTKPTLDALAAVSEKLGITKSDAGGDAPGMGTKKPGEGKDQTEGGGAKDMNASAVSEPKKKRTAPTGEAMKAARVEDLAKNLWDAAQLAVMLMDLKSIMASAQWEAMYSGEDPTPSATAFKPWIIDGIRILGQMIQEECADLSDGMDDDDVLVLEMAAGKVRPGAATALGKAFAEVETMKKAAGVFAKAGARNSKADSDKIQAMHDNAVDLGASCGGDADKAHEHGDLAKVTASLATITAGRDMEKARGDALQKTLDEQILPMLKAILDQPVPVHIAGTRAVLKGASEQSAVPLGEQLAKMQADDPDGYRLLLTKVAQSQPRQMQLAT